MRGTSSPPFLVLASCASFDLSLAFPFCLLCDGSGHQSSIGFLVFVFLDPLKSKQTNLRSILVLDGSLILLITFDIGFLQKINRQVCFIKEPPKSQCTRPRKSQCTRPSGKFMDWFFDFVRTAV
jgi:hypothetical protein